MVGKAGLQGHGKDKRRAPQACCKGLGRASQHSPPLSTPPLRAAQRITAGTAQHSLMNFCMSDTWSTSQGEWM